MHSLDFRHAWIGRMPICSPVMADQVQEAAKRLVSEDLPFLTLPYVADLSAQLTTLEPYLHTFKHMVVLGIGGSALGARALQKAFFPQQDLPKHSGPWLWILDNVDALSLEALQTRLDPEDTLLVVVSKSGGTIETLSQYFVLREWLEKSLGNAWTDHLLLVTDSQSGFLRAEVVRLSCRSLPVPENLGGRYSVISAVGMLPAAFLGLPWRDFLNGAQDNGLYNEGSISSADLYKHPAWNLAEWAFTLIKYGYTQLIFFSYIPAWTAFGDWFAQLWAESLGKEGCGSMPLPATGVTDQHSLQQMFLEGPKDKGCIQIFAQENPSNLTFPAHLPEGWQWLQGHRFSDVLDAECLGSAAALVKHQIPLVRLSLERPDARSAGKLMSLCMATTLFTGWLLKINPLDQPAVELGKRLAKARLGAPSDTADLKLLADFDA